MGECGDFAAVLAPVFLAPVIPWCSQTPVATDDNRVWLRCRRIHRKYRISLTLENIGKYTYLTNLASDDDP